MYDVIIVGAGVSGLACALMLDKKLNVLLLEKNECIAKKLELTGNKRCNITTSNYGSNFLDNIHNHKFMYSAFSNFDNFSLIEYMNSIGVELKEEEHGRMFPKTNKSSTVVNAFKNNLKHVDIKLTQEVIKIEKFSFFKVSTKKNAYQTKKLVIATGGMSYPHTGSNGFGFKVAKQFNHDITKLFPSEAPLYSSDSICIALQGVTLSNVALKYNKKTYSGYNLLFTHFGLSGPLAMRQCYNIVSKNINEISIDFLPSISSEFLAKQFAIKNFDVLKEHLPKSVINYFTSQHNVKENLSKKQIYLLVENLKNYKLKINKYSSLEKAFVTAGGIITSQVNNKSFESLKHENLYFIGELLDVHAHTGGYNITTYFSMGYNCAKNINKSLLL